MTNKSTNAFERLHEDDRDKADLGGLLEQFNLPPTVIATIRRHQKAIVIAIVIVALLVVFWALFDSYKTKQHKKSIAALAATTQVSVDERTAALDAVIAEHPGSSAAIWAQVEKARILSGKEDYAEALQLFTNAREQLSKKNPLFPLVTYSIGQASEAAGELAKAREEYEALKTYPGYENVGYSGVARIYEREGKNDLALNEYEQYMGLLDQRLSNPAEQNVVKEKITQLKGML